MAFITIEDLYGTAEIIAFENAVINAGKSLIEENIVVVDGRLSIRDDQEPTIIANEIKDLGEEKPNVITFDITNYTEEQKEKLRCAIKYFSGDRNNMNIQVKMENEGTKKMTREDALRRLEEARRLKREYVKELEKKMKEDFKKRTGQDATYFEVW